jgi:hypothetical protein
VGRKTQNREFSTQFLSGLQPLYKLLIKLGYRRQEGFYVIMLG